MFNLGVIRASSNNETKKRLYGMKNLTPLVRDLQPKEWRTTVVNGIMYGC